MPSVFSHSAVVAGPRVGGPGSLIASGRTVTGTGDDAGAEDAAGAVDDRARERAATPAELTAVGPVAVAAAAVAAATAVTPAAKVSLALCLQAPKSRTSGHYPTVTGYQPSGLPGCGWKS